MTYINYEENYDNYDDSIRLVNLSKIISVNCILRNTISSVKRCSEVKLYFSEAACETFSFYNKNDAKNFMKQVKDYLKLSNTIHDIKIDTCKDSQNQENINIETNIETKVFNEIETIPNIHDNTL